MKVSRTIGVLFIVGRLAFASLAAQTPPAPDPPPAYKMAIVMLNGERDGEWEWIIVLNESVAFKSEAALRKFLAKRPRGTKLEWSPGCVRTGDEPILKSEADFEGFKAFCRKHGIELTVHPSG